MKKLSIILLSGLLLCVFSQPLAAGDDPQAATKCPKKAAVVLETVKAETFFEYQYYSLQAQPGTVAVKSAANGLLAEARIGEGSQVFAGQEILAIETISAEELKNLEADAAAKKKIWTNRLNWKEKSPKAIQSAEKSYNEALALLADKKAMSRQPIIAPATGYVHFVQDLGSEVVVDAVLLEIANPGRMIYTLARAGTPIGAFAIGLTFDGVAENYQGQAEVIAVSDERITFAVANASGLLKEDTAFAVKKLKTEHADAVVVPATALFNDSLGDFVYVAEKKKAKKVYVTRGASESGRVVVSSGLTAGMALVVSGFDCLADGKKLRIVNEEEMAKEKAAAQAKQKKVTTKTEQKWVEQNAAAAQLRGIEEFVAHLEANKEALQYERFEKGTIRKQPALMIYSGLETQKKLIDLVKEYSVDKITFELKDERVISTIIFKTAAKAAVKYEKPEVGEKVRLFGNRLRIAAHGTYYMMLDQNFKDTYVALSGFGGSIAFQFARKMDFWISGGMAAKNNQPEWSPAVLKFKMIPLAADLRYFLMEKGKLSAFAGAGASVFLVTDDNPIEQIKATIIGFNALAGGYYQLSRKIFAQLFLKFNMAQKDIYPDSDLDNPLNLGGLELNLGVGIRL